MQAGDRALSEAMVCGIGAVAAASVQKPGRRWDRVIAIWLDGVRAPGLSELPGR